MNPNEIATKQDLQLLHQKMTLLMEEVAKFKVPENHKQETYLTSREVMKMYKMSRSHLSDLRNEGKMPYSDSLGILLYPKSEIEKLIKDGFNRNSPSHK